MRIRKATPDDLPFVLQYDRHIRPDELQRVLAQNRLWLCYSGDAFLGWLRYGMFWDDVPFLNLLYVLEPYRRMGYGQQMMLQWEKEMRAAGCERVMTSTQADEDAQHFYRRLGYADSGCLLWEGQATELLFVKRLAAPQPR